VIGNTAATADSVYDVSIAHPAICSRRVQKGGWVMTTAVSTKISYARILVPTDFSDSSNKALDYAKAIGNRDHSEILLTHVFAPVSPITPPEAGWFDEAEALQRVSQQLEDIGFELRAEGLSARAISLSGSVHQEILSAAERERADLIVLGTHLKAGWERLFLGSDAEAVYRQAKPPVLVIGPRAQPIGIRSWQPRAIVCTTDLSLESAPAAVYAYNLAEEYHARFILFHAIDPTLVESEDKRRQFEDAFHRLTSGTTVPRDSWRSPITWAALDAAIVHQAEEVNADLIVMGAISSSLMKRHFLHGTSSRVIDTASCPVLIVHR
jgi:nucleotide-binding universal stress UspA family protein